MSTYRMSPFSGLGWLDFHLSYSSLLLNEYVGWLGTAEDSTGTEGTSVDWGSPESLSPLAPCLSTSSMPVSDLESSFVVRTSMGISSFLLAITWFLSCACSPRSCRGNPPRPSGQRGGRPFVVFPQCGICSTFLNPNLKVSDIATEIGTNRTYVSAFFNKEAECTFYDYVNRYRIEYACNLLTNSKENIVQIAEKSGFNSSQSFIRVFSKIKGTSPTKYRKEENV